MSTHTRRSAFLVAALVVLPLAAIHGLSAVGLAGLARRIELSVLDLSYRARATLNPPPPVSPDLVLIAVDDESQTTLTSMQSGWHFWAAILETIAPAEPRAVAFDFLLDYSSVLNGYRERVAALREKAEAQGELTPEERAEYEALERDLDSERMLEGAIRSVPVILPVACDTNTSSALAYDPRIQAQLPILHSRTLPLASELPTAKRVHRMFWPKARFAEAAVELAQSCEIFDTDGVLRRDLAVVNEVLGSTSRLLPSYPVVMARHALRLPPDAVKVSPDGRALELGPHRIPMDARGRVMIDFGGPRGSFRSRAVQGRPSQYSARDVLAGAVPIERFRDRVVFIGDTRFEQKDRKVTPFSDADLTSGIEKIAMQTDALVRGGFSLRRPPLAERGYLLTVFAGVLAAFVATTLRPRWTLALAIPSALGIALTAMAVFVWTGMWFDSAFPAAAAFFAMVAGGYVRYHAEEQERVFLEEAFGKYLSPALVQELKSSKDLRLQGDERELTILFADLREFTARSETLPAPVVVRLLNEHLGAMSRVVLEHGGTLDKYIGDCLMAFWGAPVPDPAHAETACRAALRMLEVLGQENERRRAEGREQLEMGIGVATGRVAVGNMGSELRFDYTVIGDAVNLASRLEGLTKETGHGVLVSESTRASLPPSLATVDLGRMRVKGKADLVQVFALEASRRAPAIKAS